jgi:hypothetical protein
MPQTRSHSEDGHSEHPRGGGSRAKRYGDTRTATLDGGILAIRAEIGELGTRSVKASLRVQTEMFDAFQAIGREWMDRAAAEAELALNLPNRLTCARSMPDAISAYQEWLTEWLALCGEDGRHLISDGQKIVNTTRTLTMP